MSPDPKPCISLSNIENHKPQFALDPTTLPESAMWKVFDECKFHEAPSKDLVPLSLIISRKDESEDPKFITGEKPDPRETAYRFMVANAGGHNSPRAPILVVPQLDGTFDVLDGNATAQIIMLAGWEKIPCIILGSCNISDE